jgi:hypothetical protein
VPGAGAGEFATPPATGVVDDDQIPFKWESAPAWTALKGTHRS